MKNLSNECLKCGCLESTHPLSYCREFRERPKTKRQAIAAIKKEIGFKSDKMAKLFWEMTSLLDQWGELLEEK